jgi:hypothetical protein
LLKLLIPIVDRCSASDAKRYSAPLFAECYISMVEFVEVFEEIGSPTRQHLATGRLCCLNVHSMCQVHLIRFDRLGHSKSRLLLRHARVRRGQGALKSRPVASIVDSPDLSAVSFNDRSTDRQSHTHSVGLRRDECIEQTVDALGVNSRA